MATAVDIGSLIARSPEIRGGRPFIAGTGMMVRTIAICHNMGEHLNLAQIHAAISYYYANRDEIDTDIADESALYDKLCRDNAHPR